MSWDGGRSGSGAVIVGFRNRDRIVRVSPDSLRDTPAEDVKGGVGGEVVKKLQVFKRNNHVPSRASKKSLITNSV